MAVRFVPNPVAGAELARTPEMMAFLLAKATEAAEASKAIAPVRTGRYRAGIGASVEPGRARINAFYFTSHWIEFGTGQPGPTPAFAPLRRGAEAVGLRLSGAGP